MRTFTIRLAKEASKILMKHYGKIRYIKKKRGATFVTNADFESENKIISMIRKKYPHHGILSEEAGIVKKGTDYKWIIDPLDGTHNYIHSLPMFGVNIALEHKKEIIIGVIYFPILNKLFVAEKGKGAFMNNKKIKVSKTTQLNDSLLLFEGSLHVNSVKKISLLKKLSTKVFRVRLSGAACFDLSSVAQGNADFHLAFNTKPWDVAAGFLLIKEAGGKITDFKGNKVNHYCRSFVASNTKLHKKILGIINNKSRN